MTATFPGGVKVFTTKQAGDQIASAHINDLQDEVVAVETELRKTSGSVVSHGSLAGLSNNDHPQYVRGVDLGTWIAYTPTWTADTTNPSIGNGTLVGRYTQIGKTCTVCISFSAGSTTTFGSGNWSFGLPKTAKNISNMVFFGIAHIRKPATANYERVARITPYISATTINAFIDPTPGSNSLYINSTTPLTWGSGDTLDLEITYEIA